jgi:S1-C subfamily serine protease
MTKQHIIEKYRKNIVFIGLKSSKQWDECAVSIIGTGFVIEGKYVVTCAQIYDRVTEDNGSSIFAGILQEEGLSIDHAIDHYWTADLFYIDRDDERDICVLGFREPKDIGFSIDDILTEEDGLRAGVEALYLGFPITDDIIKSGIHPYLFAQFCTVGSVIYDREGSVDFIQIDGQLNPSSMGSPLIDISSEKIIGIMCGSFKDLIKNGGNIIVPKNIAMARPSLSVFQLLDNPECSIFCDYPDLEDFMEE